MTKEFVPYAEALELKELGFDEPCICGYSKSTEQLETYSRFLVTKDSFTVDAPTFSQAFRWFRDNHGLYQSIEFNERYGKWISRWCHINGSMGAISTHIKYEDAEDACLNKFIELVKTKQ